MKKLLLFSLLLTFCTYLVNAQDVLLEDFENGIGAWTTWGAPLSAEANPSTTGNTSDSVALLDQSGGAWSGIANWANNSLLTSDIISVSVDVYFKNTGGTLKLQMDNSISSGANFEGYVDVVADTWTTVTYDISASAMDYKQIAFQSSVADSLYLDNITLVSMYKEIVTGGGMEDASAWTTYSRADNADTAAFEFNYTTDGPTAGDGGCLKITAFGACGGFVKQAVTIIPGHTYSFTGAFKNISDSISNSWLELILTKVEPVVDAEFGAGDAFVIYARNSWMAAPDSNLDIDGTFEDDFVLTGSKSSTFLIPDTVTETDWYVLIKAGSSNTAGAAVPTMEYLFDNISLVDLGVVNSGLTIENDVDIVNIADAADYSVTADISWDTTNFYLKINVIDDTIFNNGGNVWEQDNIEVYFDMNNAKASAFDDDDVQLRLMNDSTFASLNSLGGVTMVYAADSVDGETVGYSYDLTFVWDSLLVGFAAEVGTQFGFDILASDNDGNPSYRDQVSWNSISGNLWNTPYYWGTLELRTNGTFLIIPDDEAPSTPVVTATVDGSSVKLEWTSEDNTAIANYIISGDAKDTVTTKSLTVVDLAAGDYEFGVVAVDIYGNKSAKGTASATIEGGDAVENITASNFNIYPNPATSELRITGVDVELVELFNINGSILKTYNNSVIDISDIETGLYILKVYT
ncbi:sugar-binding protein, partial [Bacteroidota bacterium]